MILSPPNQLFISGYEGKSVAVGSLVPHLLSELTLKVTAELVLVRCRSLSKPWTKQGLGFRLTLHFRGWRGGVPGPCELEESGV